MTSTEIYSLFAVYIIFGTIGIIISYFIYKISFRFKVIVFVTFVVGVCFMTAGFIFGFTFSYPRLGIGCVTIGVSCYALVEWLMRELIRPIKEIKKFIETLSKGDFTHQLELKRKDELGHITGSLNTMIMDVSALINTIKISSNYNHEMADDLAQLSNQMSEKIESTFKRADTVATAAKDTTSNMTIIAAAMEQASTNITMIASAVEENTIALNNVAESSTLAREASDNAYAQSKSASDRVGALDQAAQDISKVTETITEISEQTNLLALNATIEAARAGDLGKGFAVVAGEIKELARQTAEATQEIKGLVEGVQDTAVGTINEIEQITGVINNSNEIVAGIVTAVEEQSIATSEIASNVAQASEGLQEVSENVSKSLTSLERIADDIQGVNKDAEEISESSLSLKENTSQLSNMAGSLENETSKFKVG